jgi:hypothetical protein
VASFSARSPFLVPISTAEEAEWWGAFWPAITVSVNAHVRDSNQASFGHELENVNLDGTHSQSITIICECSSLAEQHLGLQTNLTVPVC